MRTGAQVAGDALGYRRRPGIRRRRGQALRAGEEGWRDNPVRAGGHPLRPPLSRRRPGGAPVDVSPADNVTLQEPQGERIQRCEWIGSWENVDPLALAYHDEEWGLPSRDDV